MRTAPARLKSHPTQGAWDDRPYRGASGQERRRSRHPRRGPQVATESQSRARRQTHPDSPPNDLVGWGYEKKDRWATLRTATSTERIPSEQGCYHACYEAIANAVRKGTASGVG